MVVAPSLFCALLITAITVGPLANRAHATTSTYTFAGGVVANSSFGLNPAQFGSLTNSLSLSGSATIETGLSDSDPGSSSHGSFNGAFITLNLTIAGVGTWTSSSQGHYDIWDNQPAIYPYGDAFSIVGGDNGARTGPAMGGNYFSGLQIVFGGNDPSMLLSDTPPATLNNWEHGYLYLNYFSSGPDPLPTTVRMEFSPVNVPEPTTFSLFGLGALALLLARGKKRRC